MYAITWLIFINPDLLRGRGRCGCVVVQLLVKDPKRRFTPEQALAHPFIQQANEAMNGERRGSETSPDVVSATGSRNECQKVHVFVLTLAPLFTGGFAEIIC
jgi:serine/threonine protein kinase